MSTQKIIEGDCLEELKKLPNNSVDSVITDPPYELGFMGKGWDKSGVANNVELWKQCLRVLKPGGHLFSFGGTRTYHRMTCAIEDAGFEIRDMIEWVYGSGFPKSLNIGLDFDRQACREYFIKQNGRKPTKTEFRQAWSVWRKVVGKKPYTNDKSIQGNNYNGGDYERVQMDITEPRTEQAKQWEGWGTALKPAHEPIVLARKPLSEKSVAENVLKWGTGGINIDGSRVEILNEKIPRLNQPYIRKGDNNFGGGKDKRQGTITGQESIGRFPANLIHDNSEEVRECFPETETHAGGQAKYNGTSIFGFGGEAQQHYKSSSGNASRFFKSIIYTAKSSKAERNMGCEELEIKGRQGKMMHKANNTSDEVSKGFERFDTQPSNNNHPTVKPVALMEYLIKMITPPKGIVLDPFAGSGSTLIAAKQNGFQFIGIEREVDYVKIAQARLASVKSQEKLF